jgi:DNA-directed RNA polymerase specialized sigma24 family protein
LPAEQREAIVLKYADDLTYEEMSRITGAGESALKMRVPARIRAAARNAPGGAECLTGSSAASRGR